MTKAPEYGGKKFTCPHCNVTAQQQWSNDGVLVSKAASFYRHSFLNYRGSKPSYAQAAVEEYLSHVEDEILGANNIFLPAAFSIAICESCNDFSLWINEDIIYPAKIIVDPPNEDLNNEIKSLYNEASLIFSDSPKGATALLRLSLQLLLKQLGKNGKNINTDIKELVADGLSIKIQKALDLLRVVGNNAVHPGQINLDDDSGIALKLFKILNIIADEMITKPKEIDELYNDVIPDETKGHIEQRDGG